MNKQEPGKEHTFVSRTGETDTGILPSVYGKSNQFAVWFKKANATVGGCWISRAFQKNRSKSWKRGERGLLGRMKYLLRKHKYNARDGGYLPPLTTSEHMLCMWTAQKGLCVACTRPLELLKCAFDHNHSTGEPRGFVHHSCNHIEGLLTSMTNVEYESFMEFIRKINMPRYDKVYDQISRPDAGTTTPAGKVSGDIKNDALSNPSRFSRNHTTVAEVKPDSQVTEAHECQEGTNMELTWTRYGHDKKNPKTGQQFKKNFNNPTDDPSDLKVKE